MTEIKEVEMGWTSSSDVGDIRTRFQKGNLLESDDFGAEKAVNVTKEREQEGRRKTVRSKRNEDACRWSRNVCWIAAL
jgi:hypothetical protein